MARSVWSSIVITVFSWLVVVVASSRAADPAAAKAATKELLEKGWDKTVAARTVAADCNLNSKELDGEYRVALAHWLVLMYQNQYEKALDSLNTFFECKPPPGSHLIGLRAKAWMHTARREYTEGMKAAAGLAQAVSPDPQAGPAATPTAHIEVIVFLGHLAGFLEGPAQKAADPNIRKRFESVVLEKFDEPRKKIFSDAKADVLSEYRKLVGEAADAKQESKESAEAARQQKLEKLSDESQRLSSDAAKVEDDQKQLRDEYTARMAVLERDDAPLRQQLLFLQNQFTVANNTRVQLQARVDNLQGQIRNEKDNVRRQNFQNDLNRAQNDLRAAELQVNNVNGQVRNTQGMRMTVQKQANDLIAEAKLKGFQLDNQLQDLDREKLKNDYKQKKAEKAKAGPSSKALARETEARAFTTYDTFPLDELRETLLNSVK